MTTTTAAAMSHRWLSLPSMMMVMALGLLGMVGAEFTNSFDDVVAGSMLAVAWDGIPQEAYPLAVTGQVIERTGDRDGSNVNLFRVNVSCKCFSPFSCLDLLLVGMATAVLGMASATGVTTRTNSVKRGEEDHPLVLATHLTQDKNHKPRPKTQKTDSTIVIPTGNIFKWENAPYPLRYVPGGMYRLELRSTTWAGEGIAPLLAKSPTFNMRESKGTKTNGGGGGTVSPPRYSTPAPSTPHSDDRPRH